MCHVESCRSTQSSLELDPGALDLNYLPHQVKLLKVDSADVHCTFSRYTNAKLKLMQPL